MTNVWFTSDTHFYHTKCIEFCNRPFESSDDMTERMVGNWNALVKRGDVVYHLGDFAFTWNANSAPVEKLLSQLNGSKHLITGNHDRKASKTAKGWTWVGDYKRIKVNSQRIVLFHYCIRSWHGQHRGAWHLYGHSHGSLEDDGGGLCLDVGVDVHNYRPVSFDEVKEFMATREPVVVDHHNQQSRMNELLD